MRQLVPEPLDDLDPAAVHATIPRPPPAGRPWVLLNMVASLDGSVTLDGRSGGLGGPGDRAVFHALRSVADVVLVGAGTARTERYGPARPSPERQAERRARGQAAVPPIAVVSRRLALDWDAPFFTEAVTRPIVVTCRSADPTAKAAAVAVADVIEAGADTVDPAAAVRALGERGHRLVLCEGGPLLNRTLLDAGLVDELCLTIAPLVTSATGPRIVAPATAPDLPPTRCTLTHLWARDDELYGRYVVGLAGGSAPAGP